MAIPGTDSGTVTLFYPRLMTLTYFYKVNGERTAWQQ